VVTNIAQPLAPRHAITLPYYTLRTVTSPEDTAAGRKRYEGVASAEAFFHIATDENVRGYLAHDDSGKKRKGTLVNLAIRQTLENDRASFPLLNSGIVLVAREANVEDDKKRVMLTGASIINGAQTQGVLVDFFKEHPDDKAYPSVNFELIITDDEELIADISISRNFQNDVKALSIYGREKLFDELEARMQEADPTIKLRKSETDYGPELVDTEKLVQVLTVMTPQEILLPSAMKSKKTPETTLHVYAYRHRSRCLKDFAEVMSDPKTWSQAHKFFLDAAPDAWRTYKRLKGEQAFSRLVCVQGIDGEKENGRKKVAPDGVPDGIVFPMLSAISRFMKQTNGKWKLAVPARFPWPTLFEQAITQETSTAHNDPQAMGKHADCYIALHGQIEMFFAVVA
jgi:AIPR protein